MDKFEGGELEAGEWFNQSQKKLSSRVGKEQKKVLEEKVSRKWVEKDCIGFTNFTLLETFETAIRFWV